MKNIKLDETDMIIKPLPDTSLDGFEYKLGKTKTRKKLKLLLQSYVDKDQPIEDVEEQNYIKYEIMTVLFCNVLSEWILGNMSVRTLNVALEEQNVKFKIEEIYKHIPEESYYHVIWYIESVE